MKNQINVRCTKCNRPATNISVDTSRDLTLFHMNCNRCDHLWQNMLFDTPANHQSDLQNCSYIDIIKESVSRITKIVQEAFG